MKNPPFGQGGIFMRLLLLGAARPLGRLQGVDFLGCFFDFQFDMGCRRTRTQNPTAGRIRIDLAVVSVFPNKYPAAPLTLFNDGVTLAFHKPTALFAHEGAFRSALDGLANHCVHLK